MGVVEGAAWWIGRKLCSDRRGEGESWEPSPRPEARPLLPSTHLRLERGLDLQVVMTGGARYGASVPTPCRQGARCGAPVH